MRNVLWAASVITALCAGLIIGSTGVYEARYEASRASKQADAMSGELSQCIVLFYAQRRQFEEQMERLLGSGIRHAPKIRDLTRIDGS